jgi:hypothetical protein
MLALNTAEILTAMRDFAREIDPRLHVVGLVSTLGRRGRAEMLVFLRGCHPHPCTVLLTFEACRPDRLRRELADKISHAMAEHLFASLE